MFSCCSVAAQARIFYRDNAKDPEACYVRPLPRVVFRDMLELTGLAWLALQSEETQQPDRICGFFVDDDDY